MTAWHDGRMLAFDVETTGVDLEESRIVTACVALVGGGEPTMTRTWLVDPGVEIPAEATAVHGVSTERARAEGVAADEAILEILTALHVGMVAGLPIVAMNARFDLTILDREARRHIRSVSPEPLPADLLRVVDPLVIDKWLWRFRRGSRKLDALCETYGVPFGGDGAHDAAYDALAAVRLAWRIAKSGEVVSRDPSPAMEATWAEVRDDLDLLHAAEVGWARVQAESLEVYFRSQGKAETVESRWPVVPVAVAVA